MTSPTLISFVNCLASHHSQIGSRRLKFGDLAFYVIYKSEANTINDIKTETEFRVSYTNRSTKFGKAEEGGATIALYHGKSLELATSVFDNAKEGGTDEYPIPPEPVGALADFIQPPIHILKKLHDEMKLLTSGKNCDAQMLLEHGLLDKSTRLSTVHHSYGITNKISPSTVIRATTVYRLNKVGVLFCKKYGFSRNDKLEKDSPLRKQYNEFPTTPSEAYGLNHLHPVEDYAALRLFINSLPDYYQLHNDPVAL